VISCGVLGLDQGSEHPICEVGQLAPLVHDRAEADWRFHVVREDQEARAERAEFRQREAITDRAHCVFADAEMKIPAAVVTGF